MKLQKTFRFRMPLLQTKNQQNNGFSLRPKIFSLVNIYNSRSSSKVSKNKMIRSRNFNFFTKRLRLRNFLLVCICLFLLWTVYSAPYEPPFVLETSPLQKRLHLTPYNPRLPTDYTDSEWQPLSFRRAMFQFLIHKFEGMKNGFFIEAGAHDGSFLSNTLGMERDYNWSGLLIEPDPIVFPRLKARNRRAWVTDVCLSPEPFPIKVTMAGSDPGLGLSRVLTTEDKNDKNLMGFFTRKFEVKCYPLSMLLEAIGVTHVDYLSLETGWHDLGILKTIPWDRINIKVVSTEVGQDVKVKEDTWRFMTSVGYERIQELRVPDDRLLDDVYERVETVPLNES